MTSLPVEPDRGKKGPGNQRRAACHSPLPCASCTRPIVRGPLRCRGPAASLGMRHRSDTKRKATCTAEHQRAAAHIQRGNAISKIELAAVLNRSVSHTAWHRTPRLSRAANLLRVGLRFASAPTRSRRFLIGVLDATPVGVARCRPSATRIDGSLRSGPLVLRCCFRHCRPPHRGEHPLLACQR
jgi:hypothetical protein